MSEIDAELEAFARAGFGRGPAADLVKETPIAKVFLAGDRAWKVKKPVDFGFLDYSTPAKRRWSMHRELSMNARLSGDIYRAVHAVVRERGALRLAEPRTPGAFDWVLEMRRFPEGAILANDPALLDAPFAETLGRQLARWHAGAEIKPEGGGVGALGYTLASNAEQLRALAPSLGAGAVEALLAETEASFRTLSPLLEARRAQGFARLCHGDLHLANLVREGDRVTPFDCIEFNDRLSEIDVGYDMAFLVMDLHFRGRAEAANRVLNGWLDESVRRDGAAVWEGLRALPLFLAARAGVRAHVSGHADPGVGARYVAAARAHLAGAPPQLVAVGGLSGSGKSTVARAMAPALGRAPGAVVLRSDEVRKRLWGAGPLQRLAPEAYAPGESGRVYGRMFEEARAVLAAGQAVMLDAVFLKAEERAAASALALEAGAAFEGVWLAGDPAVLRARVAARRGDASDADVAVLEAQLSRDRGPLSEGWSERDA